MALIMPLPRYIYIYIVSNRLSSAGLLSRRLGLIAIYTIFGLLVRMLNIFEKTGARRTPVWSTPLLVNKAIAIFGYVSLLDKLE
jgi:hypothetical protein